MRLRKSWRFVCLLAQKRMTFLSSYWIRGVSLQNFPYASKGFQRKSLWPWEKRVFSVPSRIVWTYIYKSIRIGVSHDSGCNLDCVELLIFCWFYWCCLPHVCCGGGLKLQPIGRVPLCSLFKPRCLPVCFSFLFSRPFLVSAQRAALRKLPLPKPKIPICKCSRTPIRDDRTCSDLRVGQSSVLKTLTDDIILNTSSQHAVSDPSSVFSVLASGHEYSRSGRDPPIHRTNVHRAW